MKVYLKSLSYIFIGMFGLTLILTLLHYFNILSEGVVDVIKLIIPALSIVVGGFMVGKSADKKGWLEGIKLAGIIIGAFLILTWIFRLGLSTKTILYYLIILAASMSGGMIGINIKAKK